jgi:hypothetical protein
MIKSEKESLLNNMSGEVKEPTTAESVTPNSAIKLTRPTPCLKVRWSKEEQEWVRYSRKPRVMGEGTFMITHVSPIFKYFENGRLNVVEWQSQTCKLQGNFAPTIFLISGHTTADAFVLLPKGAELEVVGKGYLTSVARINQVRDMILILKNNGKGKFETSYLQLPYDLEEK